MHTKLHHWDDVFFVLFFLHSHFPLYPCPLSQSPLLLFLQYVKALGPAVLLFGKTSTQLVIIERNVVWWAQRGLMAASRFLVLTLLGQTPCQGPLWVCHRAQLWHSGSDACCQPSALRHELFPASVSPFTLPVHVFPWAAYKPAKKGRLLFWTLFFSVNVGKGSKA